MEDKITVTKTSVSESEETGSSRSQAGNPDVKESELNDEHGVPWKNRAMELQRKLEDLSDKFESTSSRLEELEEKQRLTASEKREKQNLEEKQDDLEAEIRELESRKDLRAYRTKIEREASKAKQDAMFDMSIELAKDFIEEKSDELKADNIDMKPRQLAKEIANFSAKYADLLPFQRTKKAFKDWKAHYFALKNIEEAENKNKQANSHSESGGREAVPLPYKDLVKKGASAVERLKALGLYNRQ